MRKSANFFAPAEQEMIVRAVEDAEKTTSGEIATMVADSSDAYREACTLGAVLLSGLVALIIAVVIHHVTIWTYIPLVFILYFPFLFIFRVNPSLSLSFVGKKRIDAAVREAAIRNFYLKGLHRTRHQTGILIYISLLERKVWILGDQGINERIEPRYWSDIASSIASGIKEDRACDALCQAIARCGEALSRHFPHVSGDVNELADHLIV